MEQAGVGPNRPITYEKFKDMFLGNSILSSTTINSKTKAQRKQSRWNSIYGDIDQLREEMRKEAANREAQREEAVKHDLGPSLSHEIKEKKNLNHPWLTSIRDRLTSLQRYS